MDETDKKIVAMLKHNSRMSFTDMARELDLTEGAVRYRVKSLADAGIIKKFTVELEKLGTTSLIGVTLSSKVNLQKFSSRLIEMEGVEKVFEVAGDMDLFVLVRYDSPKKLNKIIDAVRGMRAVKSTKSFVVLEEYEK